MTIRGSVLDLLENNRETFYSGEQIAQELGVSRAAVWKVIHALQAEGYPISAVKNKGYSLSEKSDILSPQGISKFLEEAESFYHFTLTPTTASTNTAMRQMAEEGAPEGSVLIAGEQTCGRGRLGRSFYSPSGSGLYLSLLLRPENWGPEKSLQLTTMAAVSMCRAIRESSPVQPQIKWVNDIYIDDKKVCGILTEGAFSMENGRMEYAIVGVGINLYPPVNGFPDPIRSTAGTVYHSSDSAQKNRLTAAFLRSFFRFYHKGESCIQEYRALSMLTGRQILVCKGTEQKEAVAEGIDDSCRLLVTYRDGSRERLSYGEVQIKCPDGMGG